MTENIDHLFNSVIRVIKKYYDLVMAEVEKFGQLTVEPKKTSIHVNNKSAFLGIHPKKNWLDLNIVTAEPIESERVLKVEQVSKNRFHNQIRIQDTRNIDVELIKWLQDAYKLRS
jgi:hypothetical protein